MMDSSTSDEADKSSPETFSDSSMSPDSPDNDGIYGEPLVHPRVGDEYQVKILSLLTKSELLQAMVNPTDLDKIIDPSYAYISGLPMPVMWIRSISNPIKSENHENPENFAKIKVNASQTLTSQGCSLVPGQQSQSWTGFEVDCFILGLYMLGKNLLQVARFVESKGQGQVLAYYYSQFYGSGAYNRWSESRKMRNRKCVIGHRFFIGYRQQELFSRLFPRLSEESRTRLLNVSQAYAEGTTSLDEYVFTLKATVGIRPLVDAVGVGKGKDDLTTLIFDISRNNQISSSRPEIPSGKACSTLTRVEIVKYLTGDYRLSKARSNDLFWEAVWPRLLARGWHSEGLTGSNQLVFLIPGIKKFSRRKFSKGNHYFDSVSDVLARVAGEPELIDLETDEAEANTTFSKNGWSMKVKSDDDDQDSSDHERHCYLKPRVSLPSSDVTKFTVVDTSLANDDNPFRVCELRSFPEEAKRCSAIISRVKKPGKKLQKCLQNSNHGLDIPLNPQTGVFSNNELKTVKVRRKRRLSSCFDSDLTFVLSLPANKKMKIVGPKPGQTVGKQKSENVLFVENRTEKTVHVNTDVSEENEKTSVAEKRTELNLTQTPSETVNSDIEKNMENPKAFFTESRKDFVGPVCFSDNLVTRANTTSVAGPENFEIQKDSEETVGPSDNTDLNMDSEDTVPPSDNSEPQMETIKSDRQSRRLSKRSRPLTTKALEAIEVDFLCPAKKYKKRSPLLAEDQKPKRPRQARNKSPVVPHDPVSETRAPEESFTGFTSNVGPPTIDPIPNEKENMIRACTSEILSIP